MNKSKLKNRAFNFLGMCGNKIKAKFKNICDKTGQYSVPNELYQKRTSRKNRSLITWQTVLSNALTYEQLNSFEGGVVVEFVNNDYFNDSYSENELYKLLKTKLGSDENVSSIISIRSEAGSSSSALQRESFRKLINNTVVSYNGEDVVITEKNYRNYAIKQNIKGIGSGKGNHTWSGFLFVSIRGGQQDVIETHRGEELTLFNPACEYASSSVCEDINLVLSYYALKSIDTTTITPDKLQAYNTLINDIEKTLEESYYDNQSYSGNLLEYVKHQYSISFVDGQLTDPIQLERIDISNFNNPDRYADSVDLTHEEAVIHNKFYWDSIHNCVLSPARPTNLFWSYHLSNMLQQDYSLDEYFTKEEERFNRRKQLIEQNR